MIENPSINKISINGHNMYHSEVNKVNRRVEKVNNTSFNTMLKQPFIKNVEKNDIKKEDILKINSDINLLNFNDLKTKCINTCKDKGEYKIIKLLNTIDNNEELLYILINYILPIL